MTIQQEYFGSFGGKPVDAFTLTSCNGLTAKLITFGARLVQLHTPDRAGKLADIVLGFDCLQDYETTDTYFGSTCGAYANRIQGAAFDLDGSRIKVTENEGGNHIHGGSRGFDKFIWAAFPNERENSVTFTHFSSDGHEGYPGNLLLKVKYTLGDDERLLIEMTGLSDKITILNMVNHSYWNLAGHTSGDILGQILVVDADFYTPVDENLLATGEVCRVDNTPFDFRAPKRIGADIMKIANTGVGQLSGGGYDHNWVVRGNGLRPVARLEDPVSGRRLALRSTEPGVQIYTGGYIESSVVGKGDHPYQAYSGLTFETQKFPGSPTFGHFPTARVMAGEVYHHIMEFQFSNG
ncbi:MULTISPECIES: aldose epimerase family protein [unclassified Rhizobium]|uniref:aldose epimerase family protein n=1 Tax=unclassified Rhizobium TaxID=2613769 RepID=UPI001783197A|nr:MULTISPECIES: aldose epimerase family protein [unclassified Rhizobium]MBD8688841.1 galactose mutarotase [Rhizobium sp. CFBP 13644]MBD8694188.1 galactose mutarotase [Rhizobium sp. CFBP 13717]